MQSLTRSTMNLAQMIGPVIGGALHNFGGFKMPFFVLGSVQVLVTIICVVYLPTFKGKNYVCTNFNNSSLLSHAKNL